MGRGWLAHLLVDLVTHIEVRIHILYIITVFQCLNELKHLGGSVGIEGKWTHPEGGRSEGILGPTVQWLPTANTHLDLVAMAGLNDSSPNADCWLIFGFDFGSGTHKQQGYKPSSVGGGL